MMGARSLSTLALAALFGAALISQTAVAQQSLYPTGAQLRMGDGTSAYGTFDVDPGQTQTISSLKSPAVHRVCIIAGRATLVADDQSHDLDRGDCIDVEAANVQVQNSQDSGEIVGTHIRDRLPRGRPRPQDQ